MVRISLIIVGAIPVIFAIIFAVSLITHQEIPITAVVQDDKITIEYTKHQLKLVSFGVSERTGSQYTEILTIKNDGEIKYSVVEEGYQKPDKKSTIKVTLNGQIRQIHWVEQNATDKFIPPIISMVELELDQIINQLIE